MKVGDYVRFKDKRENTYIRKIVEIPEDNRYASIYIDKEANYSNGLSPKNIIKSSPSIIDLIEVGDYVNGFEVLRIDKKCDLYPKTLKCQYPNNTDYFDIFNEDIKSIVTKEEFSSIGYEVN